MGRNRTIRGGPSGTKPRPAKISAPRLARTHPRHRLFALLDRAASHRVVWIQAPPGAGKTTLAASWLRARRRRHLWYHVDAGDGDPATFFHFLASAAPACSQPLPALTAEYLGGVSTFARRFFAQLFLGTARGTALVLDNLHDVAPEGALDEVLQAAFESVPQGRNVVCLSRSPPPAALARLRLSGLVEVIDPLELRATPAECRAVAALWSARVARLEAARLHERSQGWMAGLLLLLREAEGGASPSLSRDYFAVEVLDRVPAPVRQALLGASLVTRIHPHAMEPPEGPVLEVALADLARRGYFTYRLSGAPAAYQLHPLFQAALRRRALEALPPIELASLRRRLAEGAERAGEMEDALALWRDAGAWDRLAASLCRSAQALFDQGRIRTLEDWLAALPAPLVEGEPWLRFWRASCLVARDPAEARLEFDRAIDGFRRRGDRVGEALAWSRRVDNAMHEGAGFRSLASLSAVAPPDGSVLPRELAELVAVGRFAVLYQAAPEREDLAARTDDAERILFDGCSPGVRLSAGMDLAVHLFWNGNAVRATRTVEHLVQLVRSAAVPDLVHILVRNTEAMHAWLVQADGPRALTLAEEALAYGERAGIRVWDQHLASQALAGALTAGDLAAAARWEHHLEVRLDRARPIDRGTFHLLANWHALLRGDGAAAREHSRAAIATARDIDLPFADLLLAAMEAWTEAAFGDVAAARPPLARAHAFAAATGSPMAAFLGSVIEAEIALAGGDEEALRMWLSRAFGQARRHGIVNAWGWRADRMSALCARALGRGIELDFVRALIVRRALRPPRQPGPWTERWPWPVKIRLLHAFSVEVDGAPLGAAERAQRKPLELLQRIAAAGPGGLSQGAAMDALWPDKDGNRAYQALAVALHRLRRLLAHPEAVRGVSGMLALAPEFCWVDAWDLEQVLGGPDPLAAVEGAAKSYDLPSLAPASADPVLRALRRRLRERFVSTALSAGLRLESQGAAARALACYQRALDGVGGDESLSRGVARCRQAMARGA